MKSRSRGAARPPAVRGKPARTTRRDRVEEKERAIVAAAHDVLMEHGLEGARMNEIARRADVAEGTIYLYFENKSALVGAVLGAFYARLTDGATEGVQARSTVREQLEFLALHHVRSCLDEWRIIELVGGHFRAAQGDKAEEVLHLNRSYVSVFDRVFREGVSQGVFRDVPVSIARDMFYGGLEYLCRTHLLRWNGPRSAPVEASTQAAVDIFLHGLDAVRRPEEDSRMDAVATRLEAVADRLESL
ncbi:MAG: TetR/AcrR family transcriptional regulator [Myxococcota bacterium]